jgi:hypothetical protein
MKPTIPTPNNVFIPFFLFLFFLLGLGLGFLKQSSPEAQKFFSPKRKKPPGPGPTEGSD